MSRLALRNASAAPKTDRSNYDIFQKTTIPTTMALQLGALGDALIEAGASPAKPDKASEELAAYEDRLGSIELKVEKFTGEVNALRGEMKGGFQAADGKLEGLRSEIRVFAVIMGLILSVIAAGFWHSLPPAH